MKKQNSRLAFSLIELSVVILIIGILVIGITKGSRIIRASKLKSAQTLTAGSPVNLTDGVILWYESTLDKSFVASEATDTPLASNGTIATWYDINPHTTSQNNATQSGAATIKPRYLASAMNGLPAVNFDGTSDYLLYDGTKLVNTNYTIFVVEQRRSAALNFFLAGQDQVNNGNLLLGYGDSTTLAFSQYGPYYTGVVSAYSSPVPRVHSYRFSSTKGKDYYLNGNPVALTPIGSPTATAGLISNNIATIGRYVAAGAFFNGDIGELIMFNRYLTDTERSNIEKYLEAKWGIK